MRKAKVEFLQFLCKHFSDGTPFKWEDVVKAGWTGRRWNLAKLCAEGYLRHSRKVKGAYTYARGASNGAKYGQVTKRSKRCAIERPVITPEGVFAKYANHQGLPELAKVTAKLEGVRAEIKKLQEDETKLVNFLEAWKGLPDIGEILSK